MGVDDILLQNGLEWNMIKIEGEKDQSERKRGIAKTQGRKEG